jgi:Neuraminidase (sialidase)
VSDPLSSSSFSRRHFLTTATASLAAANPWIARAAAPTAKVFEIRTISQQPEFYAGWSTLARRANGELWLTWSGGRAAHVCPFGQVHAMKSNDNGETWTFPRVLLDGPLDDRDSGVLETAKGTLIVTTFSSLAYEERLMASPEQMASWEPEKRQRWMAERDWLTQEQRKSELGAWALRSTDGGISWSARIPTEVNSPHGPVQLKDGRLLYAGKYLWSKGGKIGVAESKDDGLTWQWLAEIPVRSVDSVESDYHELHAVEAEDGTLIAQIRNHNATNQYETLQSESTDGGKTWSVPHAIGVWGMPSHLLRLRDGRLLMSYGYRRKPHGNRARISEDHGKTWGAEIVLSDDATNGDLGYPSTVELADGSFLTVWYEAFKKGDNAVLRQARWRLN